MKLRTPFSMGLFILSFILVLGCAKEGVEAKPDLLPDTSSETKNTEKPPQDLEFVMFHVDNIIFAPTNEDILKGASGDGVGEVVITLSNYLKRENEGTAWVKKNMFYLEVFYTSRSVNYIAWSAPINGERFHDNGLTKSVLFETENFLQGSCHYTGEKVSGLSEVVDWAGSKLGRDPLLGLGAGAILPGEFEMEPINQRRVKFSFQTEAGRYEFLASPR